MIGFFESSVYRVEFSVQAKCRKYLYLLTTKITTLSLLYHWKNITGNAQGAETEVSVITIASLIKIITGNAQGVETEVSVIT